MRMTCAAAWDGGRHAIRGEELAASQSVRCPPPRENRRAHKLSITCICRMLGSPGAWFAPCVFLLAASMGLVDAELAHGADFVERKPRVDAVRVVRVEARQRLDLLAALEAAATDQTTATTFTRATGQTLPGDSHTQQLITIKRLIPYSGLAADAFSLGVPKIYVGSCWISAGGAPRLSQSCRSDSESGGRYFGVSRTCERAGHEWELGASALG